ncbi:hypothetical protein [Ottowia sp.]|uniref:hypothetical protein n=1 Tax=Ottowia sp. TaxID=1898956 RepID=UPI0025FCB751|nr:hypothetical protein [Ottowia sp.]MBK6616326.1 hypothetical protein [Ottowia sp.]
MLVDVVELRYRGAKRSRDDVKAATPIRGLLSLTAARPGWHPNKVQAPLLAGLVLPGAAQWALSPLDHARVTTIRNGSLVVVGLQEVPHGRNWDTFPQAWWCRIVAGANGPSAGRSTGSGFASVARDPSFASCLLARPA